MYSHGDVLTALLEEGKSLNEDQNYIPVRSLKQQDTSLTSLFLQKHRSLGGSASVHGGAPTGNLLLYMKDIIHHLLPYPLNPFPLNL
jgi:hypothetical protein